jgi:hypothetical protein
MIAWGARPRKKDGAKRIYPNARRNGCIFFPKMLNDFSDRPFIPTATVLI